MVKIQGKPTGNQWKVATIEDPAIEVEVVNMLLPGFTTGFQLARLRLWLHLLPLHGLPQRNQILVCRKLRPLPDHHLRPSRRPGKGERPSW